MIKTQMLSIGNCNYYDVLTKCGVPDNKIAELEKTDSKKIFENLKDNYGYLVFCQQTKEFWELEKDKEVQSNALSDLRKNSQFLNSQNSLYFEGSKNKVFVLDKSISLKFQKSINNINESIEKNLIYQLRYLKDQFLNYVKSAEKSFSELTENLKSKESFKGLKTFKDLTTKVKLEIASTAALIGTTALVAGVEMANGNVEFATAMTGLAVSHAIGLNMHMKKINDEKTERKDIENNTINNHIPGAVNKIRELALETDKLYSKGLSAIDFIDPYSSNHQLVDKLNDSETYKIIGKKIAANRDEIKNIIEQDLKYTDEKGNTRYIDFEKANDEYVPWKKEDLERISFGADKTKEDIDKIIDYSFKWKIKDLENKSFKLAKEQPIKLNTRARLPGQGLEPKEQSRSRDNPLQM